MRIWLGDEKKTDPFYDVFAVVVRDFDARDGRTLMNSTNDRYTRFEEIFKLLGDDKYQPMAWKRMAVNAKRKTL
jgi:hypothetical protein